MPETGSVPAGYITVTFDYKGDGPKGCNGYVEGPALIEYAAGRMARLPVLNLDAGVPVIYFIDVGEIESVKAFPEPDYLTLMTSWTEEEDAATAAAEAAERLTPSVDPQPVVKDRR